MTIEDVKCSIKNHILNSISHRDLCTLCSIFTIPVSSLRKQNQKNLIDSILLATDLALLHHILYMLNKSNNRIDINQPVTPQIRTAVQSFAQNSHRLSACNVASNSNVTLNLRLYCFSNELLDGCPVDLRSELVSSVNTQSIFVPNFTKYPNGYFNAPICQPSYINGRINIQNAQIPYISKNTIIKGSPFYCCQLVLHPLSLLVPKPTPNVSQPNRVMSKMQLSFTLSRSVRELITYHRCQVNNKRIYKWQVLLRFGAYDPQKPFPSSNDDDAHLQEYIPPYLSISVNNVQLPLWDILPSNSQTKEGRRHSRPINISDHLKYSLIDDQGYLQIINANWWQTPAVYLYYYAAVFLERKLDVKELLHQFEIKTHSVQRPISFTLDFIREKFCSSQNFNKIIVDEDNNEDDLIISSVLPICLQCPIGKSRISCPLRSINCQHLQCFDARLYLMMNERRSVWKCPVCDGPATLDVLFVDEYFLQILNEFKHDADITEVNVNPDGTYMPIAVKEGRESKEHVDDIILDVKTSPMPCKVENYITEEINSVIPMESDSEDHGSFNKNTSTTTNKNVCIREPSIVKASESAITRNSLPPADTCCSIDLTSDSEDDIITPKLKETPVLGVQRLLSNHTLPVQMPSVESQCSTKIIPKFVPNLTESFNISSSLIKENSTLINNCLERIPGNNINRLLLPANKPQAMNANNMWRPQNTQQCYQYVYPNVSMNKYIQPSLLLSRNDSVASNQQQRPQTPILHGIPQRCQTIDTGCLLPRSNMTNIQSEVLLKGNGIITNKKSRPKKQSKPTVTECVGSRRSSRIQHQDKKKYIECSGSSDNDDNEDSYTSSLDKTRTNKRNSSHNDSESSGSSFSNKKKKRK